MKKFRYTSLIFALLIVVGCEQELVTVSPPDVAPACPDGASAGTASFTKFIAIGNSLTAGYQAGALFTSGQDESLPRILAKQFECVGGPATFNQPSINSVNGYNSTFSDPGNGIILGRLILYDAGSGPAPTPSGYPGVPAPYNTADLPTAFTGDKAALNNFGVPGILLGQALIPDTGNPASPYYNGLWARFASNPGVKSIMEDAVTALATNGSFFLFWLGNNDVLGYAVSGGSNEAIFTSTANFTGQYGAAIDALLSVPNVKGVVGNIPSVTSIPYFTLVPYNAIPLDEATVTLLNTNFAGYNALLDALKGPPFNYPAAEVDARKINWVVGANSALIIDESVDTYADEFDALRAAGAIPSDAARAALVPYEQVRQMKSGDLFPLAAASFLGTTVGGNPQLINGVTVPLADKWALTVTEVTAIQSRVSDFNAAIAAKVAASSDRIVLADVNAAFTAFVTAGVYISSDGIILTPNISPPTAAFSEDGVHPNGRGYAYTANIFIDAINAKFGASIPKAKIGAYKGTHLPL